MPVVKASDNPSPPVNTIFSPTDWGIATLLIVIVAVILLALKPLVGIPSNDSFSWAHSALLFARTGHIVYNGWGNPILLPHIFAGAIVIRLFGFSHNTLALFGVFSAGILCGGDISAGAYL